ncbi:MAG: hypothetical protein SFX73_37505 [Kofleriaceae bacterium]|nr:hypothetical protein [Kofleriaceae bacterium]
MSTALVHRKPISRPQLCMAGAAFGGLIAFTLGQQLSGWVVASQTNSLIVLGSGMLAGGVAGWFGSRTRAKPV